MKPHPIIDNQYSFSGDKIHIDLIMTATGDFGLSVYSLDEHTKLHIEIDTKPVSLQEVKLGFIGQEAQDLITAIRSLLALIDEGAG